MEALVNKQFSSPERQTRIIKVSANGTLKQESSAYQKKNIKIRDLVLDANGNIYTTGWYDDLVNRNIVVLKYDSSLNLDTNFGAGGLQEYNFLGKKGSGYSIAIQPNGDLLISGVVEDNVPQKSYSLIRIKPNDGSIDTAFGSSGLFQWDLLTNKNDEAFDMELLSDGKVLIGGYTTNPDNTRNFTVIKVK